MQAHKIKLRAHAHQDTTECKDTMGPFKAGWQIFSLKKRNSAMLSSLEHWTDKPDDRVGHLNTILTQRVGEFNNPLYKSSNARALPGRRKGGVEVSS